MKLARERVNLTLSMDGHTHLPVKREFNEPRKFRISVRKKIVRIFFVKIPNATDRARSLVLDRTQSLVLETHGGGGQVIASEENVVAPVITTPMSITPGFRSCGRAEPSSRRVCNASNYLDNHCSARMSACKYPWIMGIEGSCTNK